MSEQIKAFDYRMVADPETVAVNRLPAHSDHRYYESWQACELGESAFVSSLNGVWKVAYAKNYALAQKDFYRADIDCHDWDEIRVPAHLQTEGYGAPQYANTQYPWEGRDNPMPGEVPQRFNPTADYVKYFTVPQRMRGQRLFISFHGVESGFALWLNGAFVGYSEDSFTPSEFELTPYLAEGENKLAAQVFRWTGGSWCEDQDFFRFSGIFRDVYLYTQPRVHLRDLRVTALPDRDLQSAELTLHMQSTAKGGYRLSLTDGENAVLTDSGTLSPQTELRFAVAAPKLWSAEHPHLYGLRLEITDENGALCEVVREAVGFRRFELKDRLMTLNGQRIVFKGVNRHEFSSSTGRVVSDADIERDIVTMKRNNINAIRTSHYPNKSTLYRLCDRYGLYVIDETNLETHGVWDAIVFGKEEKGFAVPGSRPEYEKMLLDRAKSMFERDKNHACILIWSLGNEAYEGENFRKMAAYFRGVDSTRLVHYEGVTHDPFVQKEYTDAVDMISTMYMPVARIREYLAANREKPFISCEYAHAMGNSNGAIEKYAEYAYEEPLYQGGFIWDYIDQSMDLTDRYGVPYQGYGGDFGDYPNDSSFSGDGIVYGDDRSPSPKMQEVKYVYQGIHVTFAGEEIRVDNRNLFTDLNEYDAVFTLKKEGRLLRRQTARIDAAPLSRVTVRAPFALPQDGGEYTLTLSFALREDTPWAERGHEIAYGQRVIGAYQKPAAQGRLTVIPGWHNLGVRGDDFEAIFSRVQGGLVSYRYGGQELFKAMPRPNFWRAMTENDRANLLPFRAGQWDIASRYANGRLSDYETEIADDHVKVRYTYHLATKPATACFLTYTVYGDGEIKTELALPPCKDVGELPEISVFFTLDAALERLTWYGRGPEETYWDRKNAKIDVYANEVRDNMARYLVPQECGNKEDVRWARVTDRRGHGIVFYCQGLGFSALPYAPQELEAATHPTELPRPHFTFVRVGRQMGVGGDDTWGARTHPEYLLDNGRELRVAFSFKGV